MRGMRPRLRPSHVILCLLLGGVLTTAGVLWRLCEHNPNIAFLPAAAGADWIVYPSPADTALHTAAPLTASFTQQLVLESAPASSRLTVRAFREFAVRINGQPVSPFTRAEDNWKSAATADLAGRLRAGTNEISVTVTNPFGPPALWLHLQAGSRTIGSDGQWTVSQMGADEQPARRATEPPAISSWNFPAGSRTTLESVRAIWPGLLSLAGAAGLMVFGASRWRPRQPNSDIISSNALMKGILIAVLLARAAIFINDLPQLPRSLGFDTAGHERYVQFIQKNGALPLPSDGWEMYQPPLYYAGSALLLEGATVSADDADGAMLLRAVNGVIGLVHCWLAWLCLRRLFPENIPAQTVGLLAAAFIPPHLYLSQYATNEPLAGCLVTLAFYFCLRALASNDENSRETFRLHLGLGLALGAALLTKVSALLAVPGFGLALALRLAAQKKLTLRDWRGAGAALVAGLAVCGWYYGWIWAHYGRPIVGNWEADAGAAWWQDAGYQTGAGLGRFGQCLAAPLFSGFHGLADGLYSTLWGDGLISGSMRMAFRPPWNQDLMAAGYWLALAMTALAAAGLAVTLVKFIRQPTADRLLTLGIVAGFALGILYMTLRVPSYAQAKAFYGFAALAPFSVLIAAGWQWLAQKHRVLRAALGVTVLTWAMTTYAAFWIRSGNPETARVRGIYELTAGHNDEAVAALNRALELNPADADVHCILGEIFSGQKRAAEANEHLRQALKLRPDFPEAQNDLAWSLATSEDPQIRNGAEAVRLAERADQLTHGMVTAYGLTRAAAQAEAGRELQITNSELRITN